MFFCKLVSWSCWSWRRRRNKELGPGNSGRSVFSCLWDLDFGLGGLQDLQESFLWCCHPLLGDELQVWGVDRLVLFSWKIAGKLWNQQGERRSNILNDLFCVCLKTHFPSFWNPAKSAFWSFAGHRYKYMDLPLPASGTTMQWWPQTCRGNPFSESSQPFSTTSSSRVSKKSIIDLKDRLLRLIHASLDANLQSSIFTVIEVSLQLLFCAKPWLSTVKRSKSSLS